MFYARSECFLYKKGFIYNNIFNAYAFKLYTNLNKKLTCHNQTVRDLNFLLISVQIKIEIIFELLFQIIL